MKIVIEVSDTLMEYIVKGRDLNEEQSDEMALAIANGTPLPEHHGRLMIISEDKIKEDQLAFLSFYSCQKWISEVGLSNATVAIIEADKAESEE